MSLFFGIFIVLFVVFPVVRCVVFNPHNISFFTLYDVIDYVVHRKWKLFKEYGIDMYVGMFGHGKTLSMTHKARKLYKRFGNSLQFVSNYKLYGIPYVPLVNFNQLLELGEEQPKYYTQDEISRGLPEWYYGEHGMVLEKYIDYFYIDKDGKEVLIIKDDPHVECYNMDKVISKIKRWKYQGTVVLIDEIEDVLSHRNYASFPLQLLNLLTQQRKKHVYIMCSAQRFFMVDKLFRSITTHVIDCNKHWRLQNMRFYDAWDYENAMTPQLVKALRSRWWFVKNKDFRTYSTEQMVSRTMSEDFISNDARLARLGLDNTVNEQAVQRPSRRLRKERKGK